MLDFSHEQKKQNEGFRLIAGVDEVGRGPWAGPVMTAAVVLDASNLPLANDSKKLTLQQREIMYEEIVAKAQVSIGEASVAEIDTYNIRGATLLAMRRAIESLPEKPDYAFIDGRDVPEGLLCPAEAVIKGDGIVLSIACASIVAKVTRDRLMGKLHEQFPHYAWNSNAGYGTKAHQEGLAEHGITPHHRRSFRPIRELMEKVS